MKAKKDRFLLAILLIFSLLMASCNGLFSGDSKEESDWAEPTISLSVTNWNARTAFPEMTVDKITEFKLTGTKEGESEPSLTETWNSYSDMSTDVLPISLGTWTFTLQAWAKDGETVLASYEKTLEPKQITGGENKLQFELILKEVNVFAGAGSGTLEIAITLQGNAKTQVKAITGTLLKSDRTTIASDKKDVSDKKYTVEGVAAGVYIAQIEFYGDEEKKVLLGNWIEAVNINFLGAKSSIKISDLDEPFDITYKAAVLGQDNFSDFTSNTNQTKYTRRNNFTFTNPTKDGCTFLKWVDITSNTGSGSTTTAGDSFIDTPATTGLNKSVGNKTLCALFISNNDLADITSVEVSGVETDETAKVGKTITATAKTGESNYAGAVSKWIWYYVDGSTETAITTVSTACTATSTYTVEPKYYGKKIKARVVPKYDVTKSGSTVTSVALNSSDTKFTESAKKDTAKGTLDASEVSIKYTNASTPIRGTALASTDFAIKEGSLKDASKNDWTYSAGNTTDYQITVTSTGCNAPTVESGNITTGIKFSVEVKGIGDGNFVAAYDDLSISKDVFVNVKYETPTASTASLPALDKTNDYAISYHKMKFTQASTTLTIQGKSSPMQYRLGASGSWVDISTSEFGPISANTDIYLRYKSIGTKDSNGYIEESDAFNWKTINFSAASDPNNEPSGLGKKIVLGSVALSGTEKVCDTLTATASPKYTDEKINFLADDYGSIKWTWKAGSETLKSETTNSTTSSLQINEALRTKCYDKTIKVEAEYSYKKVNPDSPEKNTESKESGTIGVSASSLQKDTASLTYTEIAEVGSTLSVDKLTKAGNFKNVLGETVAWTGSTCTITSTAPESSGPVNVTVSIPGYPDITVPVNVTVKQAAPSIPGGGGSGGGEGGGSGGSSYSLLDNHTEIIPYGHIRFMADMRTDPPGGKHALVEYEYRKVGSANWYPIRNTLYFGYTDDIPLYADVMNGDEFFTNGDEIQLRFKRKAVGGVDGTTTIYYSEIDGKWKIGEYYYTDDEVKGMGYVDITEASDPSIAMSIDDLVGSYKALNGGITVKNDGDLKVSVSGKIISVEDATSFSDFAWYVDGTKISDASGSSYTLSGSLADKYTVRVEAKKGGQIHSATISVNGN